MPRPRPFAAARGHSDGCAAQPTPPRGASCMQVCHGPSAVRHNRRGRTWGHHGAGSRDRRAARRRAGRPAYGRSRRRRPWKVCSSLVVPRPRTSTLGVLGCAALELVGGKKRRWVRGGDCAPAVDGRLDGHAGCRARGAAIRPPPPPPPSPSCALAGRGASAWLVCATLAGVAPGGGGGGGVGFMDRFCGVGRR